MKVKRKTGLADVKKKFMRTEKYTWTGCKRKEDILKEQRTEHTDLLDRILKHKTK
jgi:hypothetical protein